MRGSGLAWAGTVAALAFARTAPEKIALRYHPRAGTTRHFWSESHYLLEGKLQSGPRPERSLRVNATDSIESVAGDSVVREITFDSMSRTNADYATGTLGSGGVMRLEATWTDHRVQRGGLRGVSSAQLVRVMLADLLNGIAPLPDAPVGPGDSWRGEGTYQITEVGDSLGTLRARIDAKCKSITVAGTDTLVLLHLKLKVEGPEVFYRDFNPPQTEQISGTLEGDERFSVARGETDSLSLAGTLFTEFDMGGAGRASAPTHVSLIRATVHQP